MAGASTAKPYKLAQHHGARLLSDEPLSLVPSYAAPQSRPSPLARTVWLFCLGLSVAVLIGNRNPEPEKKRAKQPAPARAEITSKGGTYDMPTLGIAAHHAAHLALSADGKPMCIWFAGAREGASDVILLRSVFDGTCWSTPQKMLTPEMVSALTHRYVKKLGNTVTWRAPDGKLHLYTVGVAFGGWAGSRIAHLVSPDDGASFESGDTLTLSPFFNLSTLVKGSTLETRTESLLPAYHEFMLKRPLLISLDPQGRIAETRTMGNRNGILQPVLAETPEGGIISCLRSRRRMGLLCQESQDGMEWSTAKLTNLPNPNSAVAIASLPDGRPVIAFNDSPLERNVLGFAIRDSVGTWNRTPIKITAPEKEISYPTLLAMPEGLHCAYTCERKKIVHRLIPWIELTTLSTNDAPAIP